MTSPVHTTPSNGRAIALAVLGLHASALAHQVTALHVGSAHEAFERNALLEERHTGDHHVCTDVAPGAPEPCTAFTATHAPFLTSPRVVASLERPRVAFSVDGARLSSPALSALTVAPKGSPPA